MDSDAAPTSPLMPRNVPFEPMRSEPSADDPSSGQRASVAASATDRNEHIGVFGHLVREDGDIAGLVAYSIYKQNKLDWLRAFEAAMGRAPDEKELNSYIIGEGTPRRLATYRHLAEATLTGNGPEIDGAPNASKQSLVATRRFARAGGEGLAVSLVALYGLIAVLFVVGFYLALHYTGTTR